MSDNKKYYNTELFSDFPKPTTQKWRDVVENSLKGATIQEKLVTKTYEEISLQPMYQKEDIENYPYLDALPGEYPYIRGISKLGYLEEPWGICQELDCSTPEEFNRVARHDLDKGQTILKIVLDETNLSNNYENEIQRGLSIETVKDFEQAFKNINLEEIPFHIETVYGGQALFSTFITFLKQQNYDLKKVKGFLGMDPLGQLVKEGTLPYSLNEAYDMMTEMTNWSVKNAQNVESIIVQANSYHDAGGNAVHELAFAISTGLDYLRELDKRRVAVDNAAQHISFSFSIGSNFFMEIAKLRAARLLWSKVIKELGGNETSQKIKIHTRTSSWNKTIYDPYVNILRGTVEAFAGVIGGTDSLHVSPFDEAIKPSDEFSRRIARNTQLILDQESNLSKVSDPAGGSWYIEKLTYTLAEKAWELFQKVEEVGGQFKALQSGFPQEMVHQTAKERATNIKYRKDKFIGTNIFPNLKEAPLNAKTSNNNRIAALKSKKVESKSTAEHFTKDLHEFSKICSIENAINALNNGATIVDLIDAMNYSNMTSPVILPLHIHRGAEPFESLRQNSERYKNKNGDYPEVFVANFGPIATYKARADFVTDFFEVGGFKVTRNKGFNSMEEIVHAFKQSESTIVVICSGDDQYPEIVPELTKQFKEYESKTKVLLAVKPTIEEMSLYKQFGVDEFIHLHVNNYEKLKNLQDWGI
ncbi:methylmalonyl-CoA mutase family protein [Gottfriedia acidiceleris]|uniref:methylmalonyl-CoA mutase family protein n=1 Tax=Bacillaceae TaxID=186817 RepID=UPI000BED2853|nr:MULTISPECIES: methylmalonyl-CoA mutase family protein [unclassified Bacillus (in: firmicutes)]PEC50147.1 methylmalonyl-CoA mutase [Bacillus sp. AFS096315]PFM76144.1 methylmalonyl-CoA mutase [Bacillus sp. AFS077874]